MATTQTTSQGRRAALLATLVALLLTPATARAQEAVEYYAVDALGSVRVVFNASGAVVGRSDYLPFGEAIAPTGNLPSQRFTGQQRDGDEGFDYFNARSYQAKTGRMNRVDPVLAGLFLPQKWNRYSYAMNSPLMFVDPTGADPIKFEETVNVTAGPARPGADPTLALLSLASGWAHFNGGDYTTMLPQHFIDDDLLVHGTGYRFQEMIATFPSSETTQSENPPTVPTPNPNTPGPVSNPPPAAGSIIEVPNAPYQTPRTGPVNTWKHFQYPNGNSTLRYYGPNGNATWDWDFGHDHGKGDPHVHTWKETAGKWMRMTGASISEFISTVRSITPVIVVNPLLLDPSMGAMPGPRQSMD
jgi:RHS repeat-associated protein